MLTCKDASKLISEGQERPLGWGERWALRVHLWMCVNCRRFERQIGLLRKALRIAASKYDNDPRLTGLDAKARDRIRSRLKDL